FLRTSVDHIHVDSWLRRKGGNIAPGVPLEKSMRWSEWGVYLADHPEPWPEVYQTTLACIKSAYFLSKKAGGKITGILIGPAATIERRWDEAFASYPGAESLQWDFEYPFAVIAELGRQSGFSVIDLGPPFQKDFLESKISRSWPHDGHWNAAGNKLAAEI